MCAGRPSPRGGGDGSVRYRYGAYVVGLIDYLLGTWHPSTSPGDLDLPPVKWLGPEVRRAGQVLGVD